MRPEVADAVRAVRAVRTDRTASTVRVIRADGRGPWPLPMDARRSLWAIGQPGPRYRGPWSVRSAAEARRRAGSDPVTVAAGPVLP